MITGVFKTIYWVLSNICYGIYQIIKCLLGRCFS